MINLIHNDIEEIEKNIKSKEKKLEDKKSEEITLEEEKEEDKKIKEPKFKIIYDNIDYFFQFLLNPSNYR